MKLARLQIAGKDIIALKIDKGVYDISNVRNFNGGDIVEFVNSAGSQLETLEDDILKTSGAKEIDLSLSLIHI